MSPALRLGAMSTVVDQCFADQCSCIPAFAGMTGGKYKRKRPAQGRPHRSAFAAGQAAAGCAFLASSRFSLRARSDSFESADLSSQLSRPPTCSTERMPFVDTRRRIERPSASDRSEEHTSELQSLMRNSYAVFCLKKKKIHTRVNNAI